MIRPTDKPNVKGPMTASNDPCHCIRCDLELFYECSNCNAILGNKAPSNGHVCPSCGSTAWTGPRCLCDVCDCGED